VVTKAGITICAEAKPRANLRDKDKLDLLFGDPECRQALQTAVDHLVASEDEVCRPMTVVKGLAYCAGALMPDDYVVLRATEDAGVQCHLGPSLAWISETL